MEAIQKAFQKAKDFVTEDLSSSDDIDDKRRKKKKEMKKQARMDATAKSNTTTQMDESKKEKKNNAAKDDDDDGSKASSSSSKDLVDLAAEITADIFTGGIYGIVVDGIETVERAEQAKKNRREAELKESTCNSGSSSGQEPPQDTKKIIMSSLKDGVSDLAIAGEITANVLTLGMFTMTKDIIEEGAREAKKRMKKDDSKGKTEEDKDAHP
ncbi:hypothetical protein ACA910_020095 [Epithemia clementina (nom. ined.)]